MSNCTASFPIRDRKRSGPLRTRYHAILAQADSIIYVSRVFQKNCLLERNHFLAAHSDVLLAVYNGEYRGGTAATIRYSQKLGHSVIILDPNEIN